MYFPFNHTLIEKFVCLKKFMFLYLWIMCKGLKQYTSQMNVHWLSITSYPCPSIHAFPTGFPSKQKPFNAKEINHISKFPFIQSISLVQFAFVSSYFIQSLKAIHSLEIYNYFTILFHENMGNVHFKVPWHAHQIKIIVIRIGIHILNIRFWDIMLPWLGCPK
jgi:hypothetical protein